MAAVGTTPLDVGSSTDTFERFPPALSTIILTAHSGRFSDERRLPFVRTDEPSLCSSKTLIGA